MGIADFSVLIQPIATLFGIAGVWFTIKRSVWCWPFHLGSTTLAIWVYYDATLYAEMGLQFFYIYMGILGWASWSAQSSTQYKVTVRHAPAKALLALVVTLLLIGYITGWVFLTFSDNELPFVDAYLAIASILTTWLMVKRFIESWICWVIIDGLSILVYLYKELYWFVGLFAIFTILAAKGYFDWKKNLEPPSEGSPL